MTQHFGAPARSAPLSIMSAYSLMPTIDSLAAISPRRRQCAALYGLINLALSITNLMKSAATTCRSSAGPSPVRQGGGRGSGRSADRSRASWSFRAAPASTATPSLVTAPITRPDLTKAWLDPAWETWQAITGRDAEEAMVSSLWTRKIPHLDTQMPNLGTYPAARPKPPSPILNGCPQSTPTVSRRISATCRSKQ